MVNFSTMILKLILSHQRTRTGIRAFSIIVLLSMSVVSANADTDNKKKQKVELEPIASAAVSSRKNVRFYKVNKALQADRIMLTNKKVSQAGCHNFLKKVRVHRMVQTGYMACSIYANKNCEDLSIVTVATEKDPRRTSLATEGVGWYPQSESERGAKVASWYCGQSLEAKQLEYEAGLSQREVLRLNALAIKAAERAAIAQNKSAKAQKSAAQATANAELVKQHALAAGVIIPVPGGNVIGAQVLKDGEVAPTPPGGAAKQTKAPGLK